MADSGDRRFNCGPSRYFSAIDCSRGLVSTLHSAGKWQRSIDAVKCQHHSYPPSGPNLGCPQIARYSMGYRFFSLIDHHPCLNDAIPVANETEARGPTPICPNCARPMPCTRITPRVGPCRNFIVITAKSAVKLLHRQLSRESSGRRLLKSSPAFRNWQCGATHSLVAARCRPISS